ncbi:hypothetical protein H6P81_019155 [Aristolochia fimbriata]|uniref:Uncharacterized protein n=1 Tax=Aristolochia fimbriata TaxID=158543 RepID=A0AAV7DR01_ARIFI|nr:hypothetical protein H6P81_019155 [Aristolochia fimbriata]
MTATRATASAKPHIPLPQFGSSSPAFLMSKTQSKLPPAECGLKKGNAVWTLNERPLDSKLQRIEERKEENTVARETKVQKGQVRAEEERERDECDERENTKLFAAVWEKKSRKWEWMRESGFC